MNPKVVELYNERKNAVVTITSQYKETGEPLFVMSAT